MAITYTIPGARTLDQLSAPTLDGQADEDARDNCVATSVAEGLNILLGPGPGGAQQYVPDELHDSVYGQGYIGFQSAAKYVGYCADRGVTLMAQSASQSGLVAIIHREVAAGHPVVVTMPSEWGTAPADPVHPSGWTHVGVAVGVGPGMIRVMNPWHGFMQDDTDDWWAARLCEGEVWIMRRASDLQGTQGATPMWKNAGNGIAEDSRGVRAEHAMATYLLAHPSLGDVVKGWTSGETYYDGTHSFLPLEGDTVLQWDTARGSVAEMGGEVAVALYNQAQSAKATATAAQMANAALTANKADLASQLQSAQANITSMQAHMDALANQAQQDQQTIAALQQQLQAAQAATQAAPWSSLAPEKAIDNLVRAIYSQARVDYEKSRKP